ncbi:MAG: heme exporter protein CcmB [Gammaproteobacteria bacterium]|jgi:heme exporter protein B|nr:heme exporter protein CcmB [Gammaproteobacteria bacterium]MBT4493514.1 heme exporter protein CcmB [Gammaproteobacteria bacterium]MBT7369848.1 heme exporter protein CcmB [Gammaproteobacteria bacterium]
MNLFIRTLQRDLLIHLRGASEVMNPLVFFIVVISLFPLGLGPSPDELSRVAPGVIWVAALLATLMSMDLMFRSDFDDGSLEQMIASGQSLIVMVLAKVGAHWLVSGLPLVLLVPVVGLVLFVDAAGLKAMVISLLLVSPTLSLLGAIGAALTVSLARGGLLVSIIVLPLYVPVLVLATGMVQAAVSGADTTGYLYWLLAALMASLTMAPVAIAASLRVAVDQ